MVSNVPSITVLMPVYNGSRYLAAAIDSILSQTYTDFEFLIIDDASGDGSCNIIKSYNDTRIRLIVNKKNLGQTRSLNKGIQLAKGEFIARIDQDDISFNNRLKLQISFMKDNPSIILLGTAFQTIDEHGTLLTHYYPPTTHKEIINSFTSYCPIAHSSVIFQRLPVYNLGGYPENYVFSQDFALWQKLSVQYQEANLPIELVQIRKHSGQTGLSHGSKQILIKEKISINKEALIHPDITPKAKRKGRFNIIKGELDYLLTIYGKYEITMLRKIIKILFYHPILSIKIFLLMLLDKILGSWGYSLIYALKNKLHFVINYKTLSKLRRP